MQVAVVLSSCLNHADDKEGETAETNTPPIPFSIAHIFAVALNIVSSVDNVLRLAPNSIRQVTKLD